MKQARRQNDAPIHTLIRAYLPFGLILAGVISGYANVQNTIASLQRRINIAEARIHELTIDVSHLEGMSQHRGVK